MELAAIFTHAPVPLAYVDEGLRFVRANGRFAELAGMTPEEVRGRHLRDVGFGDALRQCQEVLSGGDPSAAGGELLLDSRQGRRRWKWRIGPVTQDARSTHLVLGLDEITETRKVMEAARRFEDSYHAVQEHVSDGLLFADSEGRIRDANVVAENITGFERSKLRGMLLFDLLPAEEHGRMAFALRNIEHGFRIRIEHALIHASGARRVVEVAACGFSCGERRMLLACLRDVTERKRAEETLRRREARCRAVFESGGMGVAVLDGDERVIEFNPAMVRISGYPPAAMPGLDWRTLVPDAPPISQLENGHPYTGRHRLVAGDGRERRVDLTLTAIRDNGSQGLAVAMLMDASDAHEAEQARERHSIELARANAWKARFIAAAGHDIRQPLQAAIILAHLLNDQPFDASTRAIVDRLVRAMDNLRDMVNSVMDISKLEAGLVVPEFGPVHLNNVLTVLDEEYRPLAEAKSLTLQFDMQTGDLWVSSDRRLLTRIMGNLVSNAVRYTRQGRVTVSAQQSASDVLITVADTGIGIPEAERVRIFEEFRQIDRSDGPRNEGMGLGLAIVEHLTRLLGIRLQVESRVGEGSRFTLWVPIASPGSAENHLAADANTALPSGLQALVIDGECDARHGLAMMLRRQGFLVMQASGCDEALRLLAGTGGSLRLILADYRLADGSAPVAIRNIRRQVGWEVPAIVLTGDPRNSLQNDTYDRACEILHKPATAQQLRRAVATALGSRESPRPFRAGGAIPYGDERTPEVVSSDKGDKSCDPQ